MAQVPIDLDTVENIEIRMSCRAVYLSEMLCIFVDDLYKPI